MIKVKLPDDIKSYIDAKARLIDKGVSGIYFLKHNGTVVYVGKSVNVSNRILSHLAEKTKVFTDFTFISCPKELLNETETAYIYKYDPVFNKRDSLTDGMSILEYCSCHDVDYETVDRIKTHIQVFVKDKEKLEKMRDKHGYASIAVMVKKIIKGQ